MASPELPVLAFGIGYLLAACLAMTSAGQALAVSVPFGFGAIIRFWDNPALALIIMAATYGIFFLNLRRALSRRSFEALPSELKFPTGVLGFPFEPMRPAPAGVKTTWAGIIVGATLVGWLAYAIDFRFRASLPENQPLINVMIFYITVVLALARLAIYASGFRSPRPLLARILTGKLIVPGYDYVLLTPIATIAAGALFGLSAPSSSSDSEPVFLGICLAVLVLIAFGGGPSLECWRLTGRHHIARMNEHQTKRFLNPKLSAMLIENW
jgi:hypothetical protein